MTRYTDEKGSSGESRRRAKAYQWALEAAVSVPIAILLGYWADTRFGSSPLLLFAGVVIGFGALVRGLLRMRRLVEDGPTDDAPRSGR